MMKYAWGTIFYIPGEMDILLLIRPYKAQAQSPTGKIRYKVIYRPELTAAKVNVLTG